MEFKKPEKVDFMTKLAEAPRTVTRYAITHLNKDGDRTIIGANQRRNFLDTEAQAQEHLKAIINSNPKSVLRELYGDPGQMEVRPVECLIMKDGREGDAVSVWFD